MSILLLALLGPAQAPALDARASAQEVSLALTSGGRAIEVVARPEAGALQVQTPYGILHTPHDPVALVLEQPVHRDWIGRGLPMDSFSARNLVAGISGAGHLSELLELADYAEQHDAGPEASELTVAACRALEAWGREIDPVPPKLPFEQRTEWLWNALQKEDGARALLLSGRLQEEMQSTSGSQSQAPAVGLADIRRAFDKHRSPFVRRAAALAAADQKLGDITLAPLLLRATLHEPSAAVRDGAAQAAAALWPDYSGNFWYETVARDVDSDRIAAAYHLARYGADRTPDYLATTLSGSQRKAPERYSFADRDVQVVVDVRPAGVPIVAAVPGDCNMATLVPIAPATDTFNGVSVIKVTRLSPVVTETLVKALELWEGVPSERDVQGWLDWYVQRKQATAAAAPPKP